MKIWFNSISTEDARPFVEAYCKEYDYQYSGDPNFGHDVQWTGCFVDDVLSAVIGVFVVPGGVYVHGLYRVQTKEGLKALLLLEKFYYRLRRPMFGHISLKNKTMIRRRFRDGWRFIRLDGNEILLSYP